jgi:hypothetical protein
VLGSVSRSESEAKAPSAVMPPRVTGHLRAEADERERLEAQPYINVDAECLLVEFCDLDVADPPPTEWHRNPGSVLYPHQRCRPQGSSSKVTKHTRDRAVHRRPEMVCIRGSPISTLWTWPDLLLAIPLRLLPCPRFAPAVVLDFPICLIADECWPCSPSIRRQD